MIRRIMTQIEIGRNLSIVKDKIAQACAKRDKVSRSAEVGRYLSM